MSSSPTSSSSSSRRLLDDLVGTLADVVCDASVQLGTGHVSVRQLLSIGRNSVLRLNQPAGDDLQLLVHGVHVANGEVVVSDDSTSLRVTEIAVPALDKEME